MFDKMTVTLKTSIKHEWHKNYHYITETPVAV